MKRAPALAMTLVGWLAAVGLYLLIRFFHSAEEALWARLPIGYVWAWLGSSVILAFADQLTETVCRSRRFRRWPYGYHQLLKLAGMAAALVFIILALHATAALTGRIPVSDWLAAVASALTDHQLLVALLYILLVAALFGFIRQLRSMIGERVMNNLMLGRYHFPKVETRIFMFMDMKDSTTHAERLGHTRFCRLIQDCFEDMTESGLANEVEVYQYVGDEAILTWAPDVGLRGANCLTVFFDFMDALNSRAEYYRSEYGLVPEFKAGVNYGEVTVAEVGVIKRDIAYLSDVLNTAARLEGKCTELGKRLLISGELAEFMGPAPGLKLTEMGDLPLKGKVETVKVIAVDRVGKEATQ